MVKNTTGGNKSKGYARKDQMGGANKNKLRIIMEEGELYAVVTKILGNGMCNVVCSDNVTRLCIIRGKFKGKGKHNNIINNGTWVLVGNRDWESTDKKGILPKCDLLEVYNAIDKERLRTSVSIDLSMLILNDLGEKMTAQNDNIHFTNEKEEEYIKTIEQSIASGSKTISFEDDDEIDIDAI